MAKARTANKSIAASGADGSRVSSVSAFISSGSGWTSNAEQKYKSSALIYKFSIGCRADTATNIPPASNTGSLCAIHEHPVERSFVKYEAPRIFTPMNLSMKVFFIAIIVFLTVNSYGQFLHKADSLSYNYWKALKMKKPESHLIISNGHFDHSMKEAHTFLTKVDSLRIISIADFDNYFEIAVFDDFNPPHIFTVDTCSIFRLVENKKTELLQREKYTKSASKMATKNLQSEHKIEKFETIVIKRKKFSYNYRIADERFDYNGEDVSLRAFYLATRQVIDSAYLLTK